MFLQNSDLFDQLDAIKLVGGCNGALRASSRRCCSFMIAPNRRETAHRHNRPIAVPVVVTKVDDCRPDRCRGCEFQLGPDLSNRGVGGIEPSLGNSRSLGCCVGIGLGSIPVGLGLVSLSHGSVPLGKEAVAILAIRKVDDVGPGLFLAGKALAGHIEFATHGVEPTARWRIEKPDQPSDQ